MKGQIVLAKNHIVNRANLEHFQCCICYELSTKTHRCCGPCKKPFCLKCVGRIKFSKNYCPNKCSTPFQTQQIPGLSFKFQCPYDPQHCKLIFGSEQQFENHIKECPFMSIPAKIQARNRSKFRCLKGHPLVIITDEQMDTYQVNRYSFFTTVMNDLCAGCGSRNLCRAFCMWCSSNKERHIYCIQCRKLPLQKIQCPKGHLWNKKEILSTNFGSVCDMCGLSGSLLSNVGYVEHDCDIFICEPCYVKLPEPHCSHTLTVNKDNKLFPRQRCHSL